MKIPLGIKKIAAMCILQAGEQFLLLRRANPPNAGMYLPVGGKIDPHESPIEAAIRECHEETGIEISSPRFCGILTETSPLKYNWLSYIYLAEIDFRPAPYSDEGTLHWIDKSQLGDLATPPTDWWVYQYVAAQKPFVFHASYNDKLEMTEMVEEIENRKMP